MSSATQTGTAQRRWSAFTYEVLYLAALLALGYGSAVGAQWLFRGLVLGTSNWAPLLQEYVYGPFGHFLIAITVLFGLPLLHLGRRALVDASWIQAMLGAVSTGLCMGSGVALLFGLLLGGGGIVFFIASTLLFGGVTAIVAAGAFKVFSSGKRDAADTAERRKIAPGRRLGIGTLALATSGGTACLLLFAASVSIDHRHPPAWWLPLYRFVSIFLGAGWLIFGLPMIILGPAGKLFVLPGRSAMFGGLASIGFLECYFEIFFVGGGRIAAIASHLGFDLLAFLLGALTTYLYVFWVGKISGPSKANGDRKA